MAILDWGDNDGEMLHMVRATLQTHENVLFGSAEGKIEGIVPTVNNLMSSLRAYRSLAIVLNALILLLLAIMEYRAETKPPIIIYQTAPSAQEQKPARKSYNDEPQIVVEQPRQDAGVPRNP